MEVIRRASHAGSWYTDNPRKLEEELDGWLSAAGLPKSSDVRGVIAPHAGYSYSGRAAAYAFGNIDPTNISRVFLLGPSHHYYTPKCALSTATVYKTPIGDLPIDQEGNSDMCWITHSVVPCLMCIGVTAELLGINPKGNMKSNAKSWLFCHLFTEDCSRKCRLLNTLLKMRFGSPLHVQ
ncbi:unnamed protein product [Linum tenue]|uniref:Protein MEMO1 n=1 Tax=Linum tenue TaxID=586396 RepID=A0AAV0K2B0_9ROSI|nr:unnamed protein product [Linum tenue]